MKHKILLVGATPPPYHGSTIYFESLLNSNLKDHFIIYHLDTGDGREDLNNIGKIDFWNVYYAIKNIFSIVLILLRRRPDLVYISPAQGIAYLRDAGFIFLTKIFSNAKLVEHFHGAFFLRFFEQSNGLLKFIIDRSQKKIDYALVLGEGLKHNFDKWIQNENIFVIPNGININVNHDHPSRYKINFFFIGTLLKNKGVFRAVESIGFLKAKYPEIYLNVAGRWCYDAIYDLSEDEAKYEMNKLLKKYHIEECVKIYGPIYGENKINFLENNDILIYPTEYDGLPLVILEAMAAGCPVISSKNVGAISDVVIDGETGLLLESLSIEQISNAVEKLLNNPELRLKMSKAARKRFEENYTLEIHINKLIKTFNNILAND